jgi:serine/threonine protein kinase
MNATVRTYLLQLLAPALSQKFNINLSDVEDVIRTFDQVDVSPQAVSPKRKPAASPKKRGPTKNDLLKEAMALGLKVTTKMKKDEIQAVLNAAKIPTPIPTKPPPKPAETKPAAKPRARSPNKADRKVGSLEGKSFKSIKTKTTTTWTFGKLLGTGGFGAVYEVEGNPDLVIKTGSDSLKKGQDSGVFHEKAVYLKIKDPNGEGDRCGIPQIVDSGKLPNDVKANDYFIVMPRFETSLDDLNKEGTMTSQDKKKVVNDILDALNHLSKKEYLHLDIKAENIMRKNGRWYLIDYGMTERFNATTETTINPKKAGNGTPWFMSRDAHKGLMSRKADLESLVYTILVMEGHKLPWQREKRTGEKDKDYLQDVFESKQEFFDDTYKNLNLSQYYNTFIEYVDKLQPGTEPKYEALKLK